MNNEFKKIKSTNETRYVLETATAGATGTGAVATSVGGMGKVQKRNPDNILAQESDKIQVPTNKPRNFVAKNAKTGGAGAHKDKKKAAKQGDVKHKKPYMEDLKGRLSELKAKLAEMQGMDNDLRSAVLVVLHDIYNGAQAGEEMIDTVADELGDYFRDVKRSKDKTLRQAYQLMRQEGGNAEDNPELMAQVAKQAIDMLSQQGVAEGDHPFTNPNYDPLKAREYRSKMSQARPDLYNAKPKKSDGVEKWAKHKKPNLPEGYREYDELRNKIEQILINVYNKYGTRDQILDVAKPMAQKVAQQMGLEKYFDEIWSNALAGHDVDTDFGDNDDDFDYTDHSMRKGERGMEEEQGYDEVSPKSASYILRKMEQGVPMSSIIDDFPELSRMMDVIAHEHGLHPDDDFEEIEDVLMNDLEDIAAQEDDFGDYDPDEEQPDEYMESLAQSLQSVLSEKAVSKAQQRFMGMVHAAQKGEKPASKEVAKAAKGMGKKDAKDFAATKHKGLPEKKAKK